jgi:SM-20-related protein
MRTEDYQAKLDLAIDQLADDGYFIWDNFLDSEQVVALKQIAREGQEKGTFKKAGIGKQVLQQVDRSIRGDYIQWIDKEDADPLVKSYLDRIADLKDYINQTCYLGLKDYETHFAIYPENTFYKKHVDRFQQNAHRVLSFVLYLNLGWEAGDGGELAIYPTNPQEATIVNPLAGRLILFRSELLHEVLLAHKARYSITGWMLDAKIGLRFLP